MKLDLTEFILRNWRQRVHWAVYQCDELLAKGSDEKNEVFDVIKQTEFKVWTEKELQTRAEERVAKRRARWAKRKKLKESKEKVEINKDIEIKVKDE